MPTFNLPDPFSAGANTVGLASEITDRRQARQDALDAAKQAQENWAAAHGLAVNADTRAQRTLTDEEAKTVTFDARNVKLDAQAKIVSDAEIAHMSNADRVAQAQLEINQAREKHQEDLDALDLQFKQGEITGQTRDNEAKKIKNDADAFNLKILKRYGVQKAQLEIKQLESGIRANDASTASSYASANRSNLESGHLTQVYANMAKGLDEYGNPVNTTGFNAGDTKALSMYQKTLDAMNSNNDRVVQQIMASHKQGDKGPVDKDGNPFTIGDAIKEAQSTPNTGWQDPSTVARRITDIYKRYEGGSTPSGGGGKTPVAAAPAPSDSDIIAKNVQIYKTAIVSGKSTLPQAIMHITTTAGPLAKPTIDALIKSIPNSNAANQAATAAGLRPGTPAYNNFISNYKPTQFNQPGYTVPKHTNAPLAPPIAHFGMPSQ